MLLWHHLFYTSYINFIPIGIIVFHRTFKVVYGQDILKNLLINLSGFQSLFGQGGYNVTWWYMGLVVSLTMSIILGKLKRKLTCIYIYLLEIMYVVIKRCCNT